MFITLYSLNKFVKFLICVGAVCVLISSMFLFDILEKAPHRLFAFNLNYTVPIWEKRCTVILRNPLQRLGNVLFEFASAYGLSLDHSCDLYIGPDFIRKLGRHFEIYLPNLLTKSELNRRLPARVIFNHCSYFPDLFQPNTSQVIDLVGYWQSYKHFINHTDQIRDQLQFKKTVLKRARRFLTTTIESNILNLVGIHIRRGDFLGRKNVSSDKFIFNAMAYFTRKYHSVNFIIVSDDKSYCWKTFGDRNDTFITPDSFTASKDMAILTLCDHIIITVGTYGWWGAFLLHNRTGEVITDSKPDHSALDVDCAASVFFPPWFKFLNGTN